MSAFSELIPQRAFKRYTVGDTAAQGDLIGIFQLIAYRNSSCNSRGFHIDPFQLGDELRICIQFPLLTSPVVFGTPVLDHLSQVFGVETILKMGSLDVIGKTNRSQSTIQILQDRIGYIHQEGAYLFRIRRNLFTVCRLIDCCNQKRRLAHDRMKFFYYYVGCLVKISLICSLF